MSYNVYFQCKKTTKHFFFFFIIFWNCLVTQKQEKKIILLRAGPTKNARFYRIKRLLISFEQLREVNGFQTKEKSLTELIDQK